MPGCGGRSVERILARSASSGKIVNHGHADLRALQSVDRLAVLIREPVARLQSLRNYSNGRELRDIGIPEAETDEDFVESEAPEMNNGQVRRLVCAWQRPLTDEDLVQACYMLRRAAVVGVTEMMGRFVKRLARATTLPLTPEHCGKSERSMSIAAQEAAFHRNLLDQRLYLFAEEIAR